MSVAPQVTALGNPRKRMKEKKKDEKSKTALGKKRLNEGKERKEEKKNIRRIRIFILPVSLSAKVLSSTVTD